MSDFDASPEIVAKLRAVCLELPAAYEEAAWVGTQWMIGKHNFAHVLRIDSGRPPAYAKAAGSDGPLTVLTFRLPPAKLDARFAQRPFFRPPWFANIVGIRIDGGTDWNEVANLLADSYCLLAPKKWSKFVERPGA